jgi:polyhydroxyalkanoate synthesis regulator phasin
MKVFEDSRSGPLADMSVNWWTSEHVGYNDAVEQAFKSFLDRNMISAQEMTPDQARAFVDEVLRSNDPRIRDFNRRIIEERLRYLYGDKFGGEEDSDDDD